VDPSGVCGNERWCRITYASKNEGKLTVSTDLGMWGRWKGAQRKKWIKARKSRGARGVMGLRKENGGCGSIDRRRGLRQSTLSLENGEAS
jgi:hypothetical protein